MHDETTTLHSDSNTVHGKLYKVHLRHAGNDLYEVLYSNGKANSALTTPRAKTSTPLPYEEAKTIADRLIKKKLASTYTIIPNDGNDLSVVPPTNINATTESKFLTMPLHPIGDPEPYLQCGTYYAQIKYDGERRVIKALDNNVTGYGRYGQPKPILKETIEVLSEFNLTLDCEDMGDHYRVFDLLVFDGEDITNMSYSFRYTKLVVLLSTLDVPTLRLAVAFQSESKKRDMLRHCIDNNLEGLVFKEVNSKYIPASSANANSPQHKYKLYATISCIVTAKNKTKRSIAVEVKDGETVVPVGNVTIPGNAIMPIRGQVVEIKYRHASNANKLIEPVYLGIRNDVALNNCSINQLKKLTIENA